VGGDRVGGEPEAALERGSALHQGGRQQDRETAAPREAPGAGQVLGGAGVRMQRCEEQSVLIGRPQRHAVRRGRVDAETLLLLPHQVRELSPARDDQYRLAPGASRQIGDETAQAKPPAAAREAPSDLDDEIEPWSAATG
jgi:hypothetical protein